MVVHVDFLCRHFGQDRGVHKALKVLRSEGWRQTFKRVLTEDTFNLFLRLVLIRLYLLKPLSQSTEDNAERRQIVSNFLLISRLLILGELFSCGVRLKIGEFLIIKMFTCVHVQKMYIYKD
jgi:hypothetical protein